MSLGLKRKEIIAIAAVSLFSVIFLSSMIALAVSVPETKAQLDFSEMPINWDSDYVEDLSAYEVQFEVENWETYVPSETEEFTTVHIEENMSQFGEVENFYSTNIRHRTQSDISIIELTENDAWMFVTNGLFTSYPTTSFKENKSKLQELMNTNTQTITVDCWYWANPKDDSDMSKVTVQKTFAVNSKLADTFVHIFQDIYEDDSKPIINIGDAGMGTWVLRGKNHNSSNTMSAHSLGVAIDINPSTGSFYVNNVWYGNAYGQKAMPYSVWSQLPECHKKYHVLYKGCPIVEIFKAYGFYWGGDWQSGTDSMHLSYLGDGGNARQKGISNYRSSCY